MADYGADSGGVGSCIVKVLQVPQILHFEPTLDALSLRSDVISSITILSLLDRFGRQRSRSLSLSLSLSLSFFLFVSVSVSDSIGADGDGVGQVSKSTLKIMMDEFCRAREIIQKIDQVATPPPYLLHPTPYSLHPTSFTLHPTPYTLHPTPCTPSPYTIHPSPDTLHPTPYTLHPTPSPLKSYNHRVR